MQRDVIIINRIGVLVKYLIMLILFITSCSRVGHVDFDGDLGKNYADDFAYIIYDTKLHQVVAEQNADVFYSPASIFKLFANFAALEVLGPDTKFVTNLHIDGKVEDGVLKGDLILEAGGDTTFFIENLYNLAFAVKERGISEVSGKLLYYDGGFINESNINPNQPSHASYNPSLSALNLNFNSFQVSRDKKGLLTAPSNNATAITSVFNKYYTPRYRSNRWHVNKRAKSLLLPVKNSSYYFASELKMVFENVGIKVSGVKKISRMPNNTEIVVGYESKSVKEVVKDGLAYSNNLYSEVLLVHVAKKLGCKLNDLESSALCLQAWYEENYPMMELGRAKFYNGSGLSEDIEVSPRAVLELLKVAQGKRYGNDYFPSLLPLSGISGTMKDRFVRDPAKIFAKTGSMDFISALAGYYYDSDKEYSFVFISNNKELREGFLGHKVLPKFAAKWRKDINHKHEDLLLSFVE
ncbi:MAG: D-alanyl-D-alanine carboxypeptidase/D-alanyl-D-alanine-endopeptidase [Rickettsiales bacterium]|jgi:serine-type D-Ala-D-Ala carboxypeptidase/endopeptidase (penicillin-binding protein 4)|nr:D-alanyl-D-alanine carboxypeptidase/D-alanyl-D-alanine-endopeptidase [Rickettsiales bacterium]